MSILYVQRRPGRGGAQTCLARLVAHPTVREQNPVVLCSARGWLTDECARLGVPVIIEPFPSSRSLLARLWGTQSFARRVHGQLRLHGLNPQIIHANDHLEGLIGLALKHALDAPALITLRSPGMDERDLTKYRCAEFEAITAVAEDIAAKSDRWLGTPRVQLIHDGLEEADFREPKEISNAPPERVLVVGSDLDWKGWADFTDALAIIDAKGLNWPATADFTGPRPNPQRNDLGLARFGDERFRFLGRVEEFQNLLREYDLVINPSRQETFGMAAVETLAAGVPLLSTRVGVVDRVLAMNDMLCRAHDPEDMSKTLKRVHGNWSSLRQQRFGINQAQEQLRTRYSMDQTSERYSSVYSRLLSE